MSSLHPIFHILPPPAGHPEAAPWEEVRGQLHRMDRMQSHMQSLLELIAQAHPVQAPKSGVSYEEFFKLMDGLELATFALQREDDDRLARSRKGLEILIRKGLEMLERHGITSIPSVGQRFEPQWHVAVGTVDKSDLPDYQIVQQDRRGYLQGDKVLRTADVVVNRRTPPQTGEGRS